MSELTDIDKRCSLLQYRLNCAIKILQCKPQVYRTMTRRTFLIGFKKEIAAEPNPLNNI
jgi:hypothetical protein